MRTSLLLCILALSLTSASAALGQTVDADELFRQGREAMETGDHARALTLLRASHALSPGNGKLLNIALCEEKIGRLVAAAQKLRQLRDHLPEGDDRLPLVEEHLASLSRHIPRLALEIGAEVQPDAEIALDGEVLPRAALAAELPIDPGKHVITVKAPGRLARPHEITAEEGKRVSLRITVGPVAPAPAPSASATTSISSSGAPVAAQPMSFWGTQRTIAVVLGGVGVAGVVVGAVFGGLTLSKTAEVNSRGLCVDGEPDQCTPEGMRLEREANDTANGANIGLAAGGAALVAGVVLFLTAPSPAHVKSAALRLRVEPAVGPDAAGLSLRGAW